MNTKLVEKNLGKITSKDFPGISVKNEDWKYTGKNVYSVNEFEIGKPVEKIIEMAGEDHIIIMGASTQSPIAKFFVGSKPLNVMQKSNCPILIVK